MTVSMKKIGLFATTILMSAQLQAASNEIRMPGTSAYRSAQSDILTAPDKTVAAERLACHTMTSMTRTPEELTQYAAQYARLPDIDYRHQFEIMKDLLSGSASYLPKLVDRSLTIFNYSRVREATENQSYYILKVLALSPDRVGDLLVKKTLDLTGDRMSIWKMRTVLEILTVCLARSSFEPTELERFLSKAKAYNFDQIVATAREQGVYPERTLVQLPPKEYK
jgi:hypothetical protein